MRERHSPSLGARSSFAATTGLMTENHRDVTASMYDDKFTSPVTSEKGGISARLGGMRGPASATPSTAVNSVYSTSGGVETMGPSGGRANIESAAGALVLRIPESLNKSKPDDSRKGQTTLPDNDKLGTPTVSDPRWSSSSQIANTRPPYPSLYAPPPTIPLPAIPVPPRRRSESGGNTLGSHYVKASERLTAAIQENAKEKEPLRKISAQSSLSTIVKVKISAPIPQAPPKIEIVNAFLRNSPSPSSDSFADEDRDHRSSSGRSIDARIGGGMGIERWSFSSSSSETDPLTAKRESVNGVHPSTVNPTTEMNLKVQGLEGMDREKGADRGWSGGSLIDGVEWPDPPVGGWPAEQ